MAQENEERRPLFNRSFWMLEDLEQLIPLVPSAAERHYGLALIHMMFGKFNECINDLSVAMSSDPNYLPAGYLLGDLYLKLGRTKKAIYIWEQILKNHPENFSAAISLSLAYYRLGARGKEMARNSILQTIAPDLITIFDRQTFS
jgi:tetratricopeptide (TPR) repeat protein